MEKGLQAGVAPLLVMNVEGIRAGIAVPEPEAIVREVATFSDAKCLLLFKMRAFFSVSSQILSVKVPLQWHPITGPWPS